MHGDDRNGLRTYYSAGPDPPNGWEHDIQLVGWKFLGGSFAAEPVVSPSRLAYPGEQNVTLGDEVGFEFTIENLGTEFWTRSENIGVYLSADPTISPGRKIGEITVDPIPPANGGGSGVYPIRTLSDHKVVPCDLAIGPNGTDYYVVRLSIRPCVTAGRSTAIRPIAAKQRHRAPTMFHRSSLRLRHQSRNTVGTRAIARKAPSAVIIWPPAYMPPDVS